MAVRRCFPRLCGAVTPLPGGNIAPTVAEIADQRARATAVPGVNATKPMEFDIVKASDVRALIAPAPLDVDSGETMAGRRLNRAFWIAAASCAAVVAWDMDRLEWSVHHSWTTAVAQYGLFKVLNYLGRRQLDALMARCEDGVRLQLDLLASLCASVEGTGGTDLAGFRTMYPLDSRGMDSPDHASVRAEDTSLRDFIRGPLVAYGVVQSAFPGIFHDLFRSARLDIEGCRLAKEGADTVSSGSYVLGTFKMLASVARTGPDPSAFAIADKVDMYEILYTHALFALRGRGLYMLEAGSSSELCQLLDVVHNHRRSLVQDIRNGHAWDRRILEDGLSEDVGGQGGGRAMGTIAKGTFRAALDQELNGPLPRRAAEVGTLLSAGATAIQLWPHLRVVVLDDHTDTTASVRMQSLLGEGVAVYSPFYRSPEDGRVLGVNVAPYFPFGVPTFLLDPACGVFLEMLPASGNAAVLPWEADVGEVYELVCTTQAINSSDGKASLRRRRLGDRIKVEAKIGDMPVVSILSRTSEHVHQCVE